MRLNVFAVLFVATALFALAHSFPGASRESTELIENSDKKDVDTVLVLPGGNPFAKPILPIQPIFGLEDEEVNPFRTNPFDSFLTSMQNVMNRLREQMATALATRIGQGGFLPPWGGKLPEGGNTTSTTKVIDDGYGNKHLVTVNETTYLDGDENSQAVYRVRIIDVKPETPSESGTEPDSESVTDDTREETTTPPRSVETLEESDNEIPKSQVDTLNA